MASALGAPRLARAASSIVKPQGLVLQTSLTSLAPAMRIAARSAERVFAFDQDVGHLWLSQLDAGHAVRGQTLAGVSSGGALFGLEELLRDHGMRLAALVQLDTRALKVAGQPQWASAVSKRLDSAPDPVSAAMVEIAAGAPRFALPGLPAERFAAAPDGAAFAWIIAPDPRRPVFIATRSV